jgi:SAM-dependent methyltransferase
MYVDLALLLFFLFEIEFLICFSRLIAYPHIHEKQTNKLQWDVSRYQTQHSFVYEYGASLVDVAAPVPGERILDVGCGSGELTQALYERTRSSSVVMGLDADPNMISKANEQYPHLNFFQADVRNFDLSSSLLLESSTSTTEEDPRVDLIFSNAALHWVPPTDAGRAIAAMTRALKPTGRLVVEFGGAGNVQQITQACEKVTGVCASWYFPTIEDFSALLLQENGVTVTSAVVYDRPTLLEEGEDGLTNWICMFGNMFFENKSPQQVEDALQKISDMLRPTLFNGTQWTADYRRIRVVGEILNSDT